MNDVDLRSDVLSTQHWLEFLQWSNRLTKIRKTCFFHQSVERVICSELEKKNVLSKRARCSHEKKTLCYFIFVHENSSRWSELLWRVFDKLFWFLVSEEICACCSFIAHHMTTDNDFVIVQKRLFDCLHQHCEDCSDFDEQLQDLSNERVVFFDESSSDESSSKKTKDFARSRISRIIALITAARTTSVITIITRAWITTSVSIIKYFQE